MSEYNEELNNIADAGDNNFGKVVGRIKTGVVLFYASWCYHSKIALHLLARLARDYEGIGFIRVPISVEESNGSRKIIAPEIKESLVIERYPTWTVLKDGIVDVDTVISEKEEEGQMEDVKALLRRIGIE